MTVNTIDLSSAQIDRWISPARLAPRRDVAGALNRALQLRNDIAHHQPLVDVPVAERLRDLLDLAAAVDPAAAVWIGGISRVPAVLAEAPAER